jgi:tetratricopeptide (TPR) repeat protein
VELQRSVLGDRHPEYASALNQLALLLIMHGDPEEAEPLLRNALMIRKDTLGEDHLDYATNLSSLAGLLWARGDLAGAEPMLRQALDIRWRVLGSEHQKSIASLNSLEQLLQMKRDLGADEPHAATPVEPEPHAPEDTTPTPVAPAPVEFEAHADSASASVSESERERDSDTATITIAPPSDRFGPGNGKVAGTEAEHGAGPGAELAAAAEAGAVPELAALHERVEALGLEWTRLSQALSLAAEAMHRQGMPAPESLANDLRNGRARFVALRDDLAQFGEQFGIAGERIRAVPDRAGLAHLLPELKDAQERALRGKLVQHQALTLLDRVLALKHRDQPDFPALRHCQAQVQRWRESIVSAQPFALPEETQALAAGAHPLAALIALTTEYHHLSDDRWTELMDDVHQGFDRPLAVAVGRGKIVTS